MNQLVIIAGGVAVAAGVVMSGWPVLLVVAGVLLMFAGVMTQ